MSSTRLRVHAQRGRHGASVSRHALSAARIVSSLGIDQVGDRPAERTQEFSAGADATGRGRIDHGASEVGVIEAEQKASSLVTSVRAAAMPGSICLPDQRATLARTRPGR